MVIIWVQNASISGNHNREIDDYLSFTEITITGTEIEPPGYLRVKKLFWGKPPPLPPHHGEGGFVQGVGPHGGFDDLHVVVCDNQEKGCWAPTLGPYPVDTLKIRTSKGGR